MIFDRSSFRLVIFWIFLVYFRGTYQAADDAVQMCDSMIFCQGPILEAVNLFQIFNDSKDYVDSPLIKSPAQTLSDFSATFPTPKNITKEALSKFLTDHFLCPGQELLGHKPADWKKEPKSFQLIVNPEYRAWASNLNQIWLQLCKQIDPNVEKNPDKYSLIPVPYPFVVPGGRFREYYYWDAFWMMKGLLVSEMFNTTKYMIKNYVGLVKKLGFVPNGGRVYYSKRSQPPMLISMAYNFYQETSDKDFLYEILPSLEAELMFWSNNRSINVTANGKNYQLFQYNTPTNVPRPESYFADVQTSKNLSKTQRPIFYSNVASTAESGWDFGSRWFDDRLNLQTVKTKRIIPVDLNSFICGNLQMLSEMFLSTGQYEKSRKYAKLHQQFVSTMMDVFYNSTSGVWFDIDLDTKKHNVNFYPSSFVPLYTGCYKFKDNTTVQKSLEYLKKSGALNYPGGVPTSLVNTSQQWDFPNGWPPLMHMIIEGFRKTGDTDLQNEAFHLASIWLNNNYLLYNDTSYMFEKYDVTETSTAGKGGEYTVQVGFGWTNGVALDLLRTYGNRLNSPRKNTNSSPPSLSRSSFFPLLLSILVLFKFTL